MRFFAMFFVASFFLVPLGMVMAVGEGEASDGSISDSASLGESASSSMPESPATTSMQLAEPRADTPPPTPVGVDSSPLPASSPDIASTAEEVNQALAVEEADELEGSTSPPSLVWPVVLALIALLPLGIYAAQYFKKKKTPESEEGQGNCLDIKKRLEEKMQELTDLRAALQQKTEGAARAIVRSTLKKTKAKSNIQTLEMLEGEVSRLQKLFRECELGYTATMKQTITPFLWFNNQCDEAMEFYTSLFPNSKVVSIKRYPADMQVGPLPNMGGKVLTGVFELAGYQFMALDGGPHFSFTPAVSISVQCETEEEIEKLYSALEKGGKVLMPLQDYGFSKKYAWLNDRFGLSWQLNVPHDYGVIKSKIAPFFMFYNENSGKAEEAMNFYSSLFKQSSIGSVFRREADEQGALQGSVAHAEFYLEGQQFMASDGGTQHKFPVTGAVSMHVSCETQEEIDHLWNALSAHPEAEQCGWLKDKYGFAWQVDAKILGEMLSDSNQKKANAAMQAMLAMKKIDIAVLKKAFDGA